MIDAVGRFVATSRSSLNHQRIITFAFLLSRMKLRTDVNFRRNIVSLAAREVHAFRRHREGTPPLEYGTRIGRTTMLRSAAACLVMVLMVALVAGFAQAADKTHDGTVVSVAEGKLVMADKDKKEHSHDIGPAVKITLNGKDAKLADLKKGDAIRVTAGEDGKVTAVAATRA
jgi:hypothetical protein